MQRNTIELALKPNSAFNNMCEFYGIPIFDESFAGNAWEAQFLLSIRKRLSNRKELSGAQLNSLKEIMLENPPTEKQVKYLRDLGWEGKIPSKQFASKKIGELKGE